MKKIQNSLLASVMATTLFVSPVWAKSSSNGSSSNWTGTVISAAQLVASGIMNFMGDGATVLMLISNIDPAQVALEYMVLKEKKKLNVEWDPEPKDSYEKAAQNNGGGGSGSGGSGDNPAGGMSIVTEQEAFSFQVAVLQNVGIEAAGVGPDLSSLVAETARTAVLNNLAYLKPSDGSKREDEVNIGAGSCAAGYSVCLNDLTEEEKTTVSSNQIKNEQYFGTAGAARAELALKTVQQAIVDDGGGNDTAKSAAESAGVDTTDISGSQVTTVQGLSHLIGSGKNTTSAMKIVALMNLELAQRLNLGNMLQGSTLTVEAARAFKQVTALTK